MDWCIQYFSLSVNQFTQVKLQVLLVSGDQITKNETVSFYDNISYNVLLKLCREQVVIVLGVSNLLLSYWFVN